MHPFLLRALTAIAACACVASPAAFAQPRVDFPVKAVRLVVPFPPGGATDVMARQIAEQLSARWQQPVLVENKPGANTTLGTDIVAKAPPDGHVLGIVTASHVTNPFLMNRLPYDTLKDLTGVMLLTRIHLAVYAHPSVPANTPAELLALARKSPGELAYGSATTGSYLGMELMNMMAGTRMRYVAYKGSAQAITDLVGGHLQLLIDPVLQSTLEHARNGRLKLIGTTGASPSPLTAGAPTFPSVVPGYEFSSAFGLVVRNGTPPAVIAKVRDDIAAIMAQPEMAARIRDIGQDPIASTSDEYNAYILSEMKKWEPVVKATGAKAE